MLVSFAKSHSGVKAEKLTCCVQSFRGWRWSGVEGVVSPKLTVLKTVWRGQRYADVWGKWGGAAFHSNRLICKVDMCPILYMSRTLFTAHVNVHG